MANNSLRFLIIFGIFEISLARILANDFIFSSSPVTKESIKKIQERRKNSNSIFRNENFEYSYSTSESKYYISFFKKSPNFNIAFERYKTLVEGQSKMRNPDEKFVQIPFPDTIYESEEEISFSINLEGGSLIHIGSVGVDKHLYDIINDFSFKVYNKLSKMHNQGIVVCNWMPEMIFLTKDLKDIIFVLPEKFIFEASEGAGGSKARNTCEGLVNEKSLFYHDQDRVKNLDAKSFDVVAASHLLFSLFARALNKDVYQMKVDMADTVNYPGKEEDIISSFLPFVSKKDVIYTVIKNLGINRSGEIFTAKEASDSVKSLIIKAKKMVNKVRYFFDFGKLFD